MSTLYQDKPRFRAGSAVDGIYENEFSLAHTLVEINPWLRIDLEQEATVYALKVLNRAARLVDGSIFLNKYTR